MKSDRIEAFQEIYNAFYCEVYRFLQGTKGRGTDLEKATQDIFLQAYRLFPQYRGETSYKTWLFSIAHASQSDSRKVLRRGKSKESDVVEQLEEYTSSDQEDREAARRRLKQQVVAAYRQLPQQEREVLVLEMVYGFSRSDLALILDLSEGRARTLAEDAYQNLWAGIAPEAREFIEEALLSMYGQPSDLELLERKTEGWAEVLKQGGRAAMRKRWLPLASVAMVAVVVAGAVFLPGELKKESVPAESANTNALEEQVEVPGQQDQFGSWENTRVRMEHYQKNKQRMLFSTVGQDNPVDVIANTEGIYTVKWDDQQQSGVKKLLLPRQSGQEVNVRGTSLPYLLFSLMETSNYQQKESLYTLDVRDLKLTPLPVIADGSKFLSGAVVEKETPLFYYLSEEGKTSDQKLFTYDLQTGAEKLVYTGASGQQLSRIYVQGSNVVLTGNEELLLVKDDGVQSIVKEQNSLRPIQLGSGSNLVYQRGFTQMNSTEERYREDAKIMSYDILTGTLKPLLPVEKGTQELVVSFSKESDEIFISNFIPSQPPETMEIHGTLPGRVQLWHVQVGGATKLIHERDVPFGKRGIRFHSMADEKERQLFLESQQNQEWAIRYDMDSGEVIAVDPKTLPKERQ